MLGAACERPLARAWKGVRCGELPPLPLSYFLSGAFGLLGVEFGQKLLRVHRSPSGDVRSALFEGFD
jgi:hypothetical protein